MNRGSVFCGENPSTQSYEPPSTIPTNKYNMTTFTVGEKAGQARGLFLVGPDTYVVFRNTVEDLRDFGAEYSAVKDAIEALNHSFERNPSRAAALVWYHGRLESGWIPSVRGSIQHWGKEFVLGDLRVALNDVEDNLGLDQTVWPSLKNKVNN